jgi:putative inorganic carbon (hco3(-)) transporter
MRTKLEKFVLGLIALSFFMPLVMLPKHFIFPFIVPKILVIRIIILLMVGAYIILLSMDWEKYRIRLTPIMWLVLLFLASFTISTFVGVDWYRSFWDNHERMLGLFTIIHYVLYFLIITSVVQDKNDWQWLLRIFLLGGSAVMVIALLQQFNPELLLNRSGNRSAATLGNPIYVGGYGLFLAFLGYLLFIREERVIWKVYGLLGGLLGICGIFFSGTRGAFLGLVAGVGTICFLYLVFLKRHKRVRQTILTLFILSTVVLGILFANRDDYRVRNIPAVGSLLTVTLKSGTAQTRIMAWTSGFQGWQDNPVFGWGPGNFYYVFNKYYKPEFLEHGWNETWFDNAHNIFVNTLAERGAVGIALYLAMFGAVFYSLWWQSKKGEVDLQIKVIGTAFLIAHLVQNNFVFENPTSYLYFFFYLAFLNAVSRPPIKGLEKTNPLSYPLLIVTFLAIAVLIYATNINPARANVATLGVLRSLYSFQDPIEGYKAAVAIPTPHVDDIRNDFSRQVSSVAGSWVKQGKAEEMARIIGLTYGELNKNRILHPADIRIHIQQSQLAESALLLFGDPNLMIQAEKALEEAVEYSPKRQQVKYMLASVKINLGKPEEAVKLYQETIEDDPLIGEGWWRLAYIYDQIGQTDQAKEIVRRARAAAARFDARGAGVINRISPPEDEAPEETAY